MNPIVAALFRTIIVSRKSAGGQESAPLWNGERRGDLLKPPAGKGVSCDREVLGLTIKTNWENKPQ